MKYMKRLCEAAALLIVISSLTSCQIQSDYRQDLDVQAIAESLSALLEHPETMHRYDSDEIHFFIGLPDQFCTDCAVMAQSRPDLADEFGIFRCYGEEVAEELEDLLEDYLDRTLPEKLAYLNDDEKYPHDSSNDDEAEETSAVDLSGSVRRYGLYVCYTLLKSSDEESIHKQIKKILSET